MSNDDKLSLEIRIKPDAAFTRHLGRKLRAAGGSYEEARGAVESRTIYVPIVAWPLAVEILIGYGFTKTRHPTTGALRNLGSPVVIRGIRTAHRQASQYVRYVDALGDVKAGDVKTQMQRIVDYARDLAANDAEFVSTREPEPTGGFKVLDTEKVGDRTFELKSHIATGVYSVWIDGQEQAVHGTEHTMRNYFAGLTFGYELAHHDQR